MNIVRWCLSLFSIALAMPAFTPKKTTPAPHTTAAVPAPRASEVIVAAAADLKFAMDSIVAVFSTQNPSITIKPVYGSSGSFFEQINNGAPFDLFFSADADYPKKLKEAGKTLSDVKLYATGHLVLWSKTLDPAREQMNTLLDNAVKKIAIANPAHAPYGRHAEESLRYYNLYDKIKDKLVIGENIAQTAQYAQSGAADVGIIALSLALSPTMKQAGGKYWLIPPASHKPLEQGYVLLPHAKGNTGAEQFAAFIGTPTVTSILKSFGFGQP
ncbi:molybdate ABC transporter substrate-binding protein [Puia dinghuensis]|uniref:Molybdate ABC transporter substrate-binding protein n=1 Tax=Puia dinghuensis TaxID=1792502 RepID=A0A8J2XS37_9BACT|nr:molybdate ABC transporter substrate-binding protein [Puia dinghuensis]GGA91825.1 molybdate ABC transporter substrate-binding protein [Puia dinghuensis]